MKTKILVLLGIVWLSLGSVDAQENMYHHVGDTIFGRSPIYFYDWWIEEAIADSERLEYNGLVSGLDGVLLRYSYTDKPINVIGLAGAMVSWDILTQEIDSTYYQEYMLLYEADQNGYHRLDSIAWNLRDPHRTLCQPLYYQASPWGECAGFHFDTHYVAMYEYYFDKPYTVRDSFYVGTTMHSKRVPRELSNTVYTYPSVWTYKGSSFSPSDCPLLRQFDYITYGVNDTTTYISGDRIYSPPYVWHRKTDRRFMLMFPILQVECSVPDSLGVRMVDSTTFELTWDGDGNVAWEAMVQKNAPVFTEDSVTWCDTTSFLMSGLDLQTDYLAFVRGICVYEGDTVRTDWTSVRFSTPDTVTTGIAEVDDQRLTLTPNPTSGRVKIVSDESMRHVWFYDMAGKEVLHMNPRSTKAEIDLADSPKGTYIVKIKTRSGEYTRKLIVK